MNIISKIILLSFVILIIFVIMEINLFINSRRLYSKDKKGWYSVECKQITQQLQAITENVSLHPFNAVFNYGTIPGNTDVGNICARISLIFMKMTSNKHVSINKIQIYDRKVKDGKLEVNPKVGSKWVIIPIQGNVGLLLNNKTHIIPINCIATYQSTEKQKLLIAGRTFVMMWLSKSYV